MVLTERQRTELHEAILEYLSSEGDNFAQSFSAFKQESGLELPSTGKGLLEKKWTSILRLQKKVLDLEAQVASLQKQGASLAGAGGGASAAAESIRFVPKAPPRANLVGHRSSVLSVAIHPTFSLIASGSEDATIKLWDFETAQYERTLKGHTGAVTGVAFHPLGTIIASCSADMSAKLWDMASFNCILTLRGHDHTISGIVFSSSGDHLYSCSRDQSIKCWEVASGFCVQTMQAHGDWVKSVAVSSDGSLLASCGQDQLVIVWKLSTGQPLHTLRGHEHVVESVRFGRAFQDADSVMQRAMAATTASTEQPEPVEHRLVTASRDRTVRVWDSVRGICLATLTAHENWVRCAVFDPSGRYVLSCSDDKSIRVFDLKDGGRCCRSILEAHGHFVTSLATASTVPIVISGSVDKSLSIWSCS